MFSIVCHGLRLFSLSSEYYSMHYNDWVFVYIVLANNTELEGEENNFDIYLGREK